MYIYAKLDFHQHLQSNNNIRFINLVVKPQESNKRTLNPRAISRIKESLFQNGVKTHGIRQKPLETMIDRVFTCAACTLSADA